MAEGDVWISKFFSDSNYVRGGKVDWDTPGWREVAHLPPASVDNPLGRPSRKVSGTDWFHAVEEA